LALALHLTNVAAGKNREISEAGTRVADRGVKLPRSSPRLLEGNPEFEEIQADDEQHIGASTIRQTVPSASTSKTAPLTSSQNPRERRVSRPHTERGAHSSSTQALSHWFAFHDAKRVPPKTGGRFESCRRRCEKGG